MTIPNIRTYPPYWAGKESFMRAKGYARSKGRRPTLTIASVLFFLIGGCAFIKEIDRISITNPDLTKVSDGRWIGEYNTTLISARVSVETLSKEIYGIQILKHNCGKGKPAEAIVERVIASQSLEVDTVSGATGSSKVILRAIQDALEKAIVAGEVRK
jgi:uncharacterized protein with FMN-binding domain